MAKVGLKTLDTQRQMDENALLDCDATGLFMDMKWTKDNFILMMELEWPILVYNVDGTRNSIGSITHEAMLMKDIKRRLCLRSVIWERLT